jgi:cytidylate kinase
MNQIVTIDGPAGSGKSTVSRLLAEKIHFLYLDTGAMYRAVALQAKRMGVDFDDRKGLRKICKELDLNFRIDGGSHKLFLGKEDISSDIRSPEMDMLSSRISAIPEVRESMTELQREIGKKGRLVAEGRDMGTVVFADADHKFYLTASQEVRAERRYNERIGRGENVSRGEVEMELRKRDDQDKNRTIAPLRSAKDAQLIDTTTLNPRQVVEKILMKIKIENG